MRSNLPTLETEHLIARFRVSEGGPLLACVELPSLGKTLRVQSLEEFSVLAIEPALVDDPDYVARYPSPESWRFDPSGQQVGNGEARLRYENDLVVVDATYEVASAAPTLRKRIRCTAKDAPVYIAGVTQWRVKPEGLELTLPGERELLPVAPLLGTDAGCVLDLEWPMAYCFVEDDGLRLEYRPGYRLEPGEGREVAAGSMVCFGLEDTTVEPLEQARRAFFEHMTDRLRPQAPCPVKFTTWGPWGAALSQERIREDVDDMERVGVDLLHLDAGWQAPHFPFSTVLPNTRHADDAAWDQAVSRADRFPNGVRAIKELAEERGMGLSLWFDAFGCVFVREGLEWAVRDAEGRPVYRRSWESRDEMRPVQSPASEYGARLREFVTRMIRRYDLRGVMFDNNALQSDHAPGRDSMANGWNAKHAQLRRILEVLEEADRLEPGLYRFLCRKDAWPWALKFATHIHAGDPSRSADQDKAESSDCPARAMAFERRLAWKRLYDRFVPPWGIKGDIAGWSWQQRSSIPVNVGHTERIPPSGEGWTQNLFSCLATTTVRDIRFSFRHVPEYDKEILRTWLAWDRRRARYPLRARVVLGFSEDPDDGVDVISQVAEGEGVLYLFNKSFATADAEVALDERAGFRPSDRDLPAHMIYPVRAPLEGRLTYGQTLRMPLIGKDCAVIEVGLDPPSGMEGYDAYLAACRDVVRSFGAVFLTPLEDVLAHLAEAPVWVEVGDTPVDRTLAAYVLDGLGALAGRDARRGDWLRQTPKGARGRLIIGTHDGLRSHPEVADCFRETLWSRYVALQGKLFSAPLVARLGDTILFVAPRPEQLARLAINLAGRCQDERRMSLDVGPEQPSCDLRVETEIPTGRPVLRFRPATEVIPCDRSLPPDMAPLRFEVRVEGPRSDDLLWREDVPPFIGPPWWGDRVISLARLAGRTVRLRFTARPSAGKMNPILMAGFDRIAVLD